MDLTGMYNTKLQEYSFDEATLNLILAEWAELYRDCYTEPIFTAPAKFPKK